MLISFKKGESEHWPAVQLLQNQTLAKEKKPAPAEVALLPGYFRGLALILAPAIVRLKSTCPFS